MTNGEFSPAAIDTMRDIRANEDRTGELLAKALEDFEHTIDGIVEGATGIRPAGEAGLMQKPERATEVRERVATLLGAVIRKTYLVGIEEGERRASEQTETTEPNPVPVISEDEQQWLSELVTTAQQESTGEQHD